MVSHWSVIMSFTWIIVEQIQVSDLVSFRQTADEYTDSCRAGQCNGSSFLDLAPCPPPTISHLLCVIPANLTCPERTHILQNCILYLSEDAKTQVFKKCNQSSSVQCDEFVNLCKKEFSKFDCGKPVIIKPPPTTTLPQVTTLPTTVVSNSSGLPTTVVSNSSGMNDSDLIVNDNRPEMPVMNAGVGDRNWWPLLTLLVIPLLVVLVFVFFLCRKRRTRKYEKSTPDTHNGEEKLMELKVDEGRKKQRDSYIGHGDQFEKFRYIDEDMGDDALT